jgi:cyclopropane-fatty-acyl-phospholipid synthase
VGCLSPARTGIASVAVARTRAGAAERTLALLNDLLGDYARDFAVRLWDGTRIPPAPGRAARFTLVLEHAGSLRAMLWPPNQLTMAEAYLYGDIDVEGDIEAIFPLIDHLLLEPRWTAAERLRVARRLLALPSDKPPRTGRPALNYTHIRAQHTLM